MRLFTVLATLLGVALFALFAWQTGPARIAQALAGLGWCAPLLPLPWLLVYALDTLGWKYAFAPSAGRIRYGTLFFVRFAGESINLLTPTAYVGGEPVKAYLLARRGLAGTDAAASVVIAKTLMTLAQLVFTVIGALAALATIRSGHPVLPGIAVVLGAGTLLVGALFWLQNRGMFGAVLGALRRLGIRIQALEARRAQLRELDAKILRFYREQPRRFFASAGWHLLGWIAGAAEVWLAGHWLGAPLGALEAIAIEACIGFVKAVFIFTPGSVGFQESGVVLLFRLFGLPAEAGAAYALVRRARELGYGGLGLVLLLREVSGLRELAQRRAELLPAQPPSPPAPAAAAEQALRERAVPAHGRRPASREGALAEEP